jgi:hypothetical protein
MKAYAPNNAGIGPWIDTHAVSKKLYWFRLAMPCNIKESYLFLYMNPDAPQNSGLVQW